MLSAHDYVIPPWGRAIIKTDIAIKVPKGTYGRIAGRSGLALNFDILIGAGVIDRNFHGNVSIVAFNFSDTPFHVSRGNRVAQLICEKIKTPEIEKFSFLELDNTQSLRGACGLGSTGLDMLV